MNHTLPITVLAIGALLGITGCTGSEGTGGTEASSPPPTASAPAGVNACSILPEEEIEPLNPMDRNLVNTLLIGDLTFDGCTVGDVYSLSFGIRVVDTDSDLREEVRILAGTEAEPLDGVGDEAFQARRPGFSPGDGPLSLVVGARFGEHEVIVRNESLGNSNPEVHVSEEQTIAFLRTYGEAIPDGFAEAALTTEVGEGCPAPEDETITSLTGPVQLARGGYTGAPLRCTYLGEDLSTVQLSRAPASNAADFLDVEPSFEEDVELTDVVAAKINASEHSVRLTIQPTAEEIAFVTVRRDDGPVERDDVIALTEEFLAGSA